MLAETSNYNSLFVSKGLNYPLDDCQFYLLGCFTTPTGYHLTRRASQLLISVLIAITWLTPVHFIVGWTFLKCLDFLDHGIHRFIHSTSVHPIQLFSSGEKPTAETVAETIVGNRAELVHFPSTLDPHVRLTSKDCPNCIGSVRAIPETH